MGPKEKEKITLTPICNSFTSPDFFAETNPEKRNTKQINRIENITNSKTELKINKIWIDGESASEEWR